MQCATLFLKESAAAGYLKLQIRKMSILAMHTHVLSESLHNVLSS
jgi:hypothetical protein